MTKFYAVLPNGEKKEFQRAIFAMIHAQTHGGRFVAERNGQPVAF